MRQLRQYSIIGVFIKTVKLGNKVFEAWRPLLAYAIPLTLLSLLADTFINSCGMMQTTNLCTYFTSPVVFFILSLLYILAYLHLFIACAVDFYDEAFNNISFRLKDLWHRSWSKWRAELYILAWLGIFAIVFALVIKLLLQKTNPDWRVEFVYFCIIFTGIVFCLLLLRAAAAVSIYLSNAKSSIFEVLQKTTGKAYVAVILFLILFAVELLGGMRIRIWLEAASAMFPWLHFALLYIDMVIKLGLVALMLIFFRAQHELLQQEDIKNDAV